MSPPRSSRSTRSERGGVRSGFFDVRGLSGSVPELDDPVWLRRGELASDDPLAGGDCGVGFSGSELCCAHNPRLSPSVTPKAQGEDNLSNIPPFYPAHGRLAYGGLSQLRQSCSLRRSNHQCTSVAPPFFEQ